ncbi:hypothetical protein IUY40_06150 [Flavobacterium sp. ALJ2]|uniref:hypothetical protein n=1 Tax=Flavobacterium sp. ALJ2 TaxID=2786960 RepID=UPI00189CDCD1|nr:hypothetical protein [Flavobacterium sp. ALJ2]MBF7091116.1 hypothetical protein [Flavobacterium sp. ALJ2]
MTKQSKITVKHYLEKKVKPTMVYDDLPLGYPLYYRITYKRKTTNLKSFTGAIMTEKAYEHFKTTNEVLSYETNYKTGFTHLKLEDELLFLEKAIEQLVNKNSDIVVFDEYFVENLKTFFNDLRESLYFQGWYSYKQKLDLRVKDKSRKSPLTVSEILNQKIDLSKEDIDFNNQYKKFNDEKGYNQERFYHIFDKGKSLIECLNIIKEVTEIDLFPYIHKNTLKYWQVIGLILIAYPRTIFIDFFVNYDIKKILDIKEKNNVDLTAIEVTDICNKLKNNHLGIYFK